MKSRNLVVYAIAAATLGVSSLSFAQDLRRGDRFDEPRIIRVDDRRDDRRDFRQERRADRHDYRHGPQVRYYQARGPQFQRGRYIPQEYRSRQYVVVNHQQHRLYAPPRGHQWVQVGGDYVLIAIATGLIANLILNN